MDYNEILNSLKEKLGDSQEENEKLLRAEGERFAAEGNAAGVDAVTELLTQNMPDERREEIKRLTHLDGMRLDEMQNKIISLINEKKIVEAVPLSERLYKKVTLEFADTDTAKFVSLRNPFEDNLCQILFPTDKILNRTPFDFAAFLTTYAYLLVDTGANVDAIPVLERAIEYNPVDVGPRFELAEIYKIIRNKKMLLQVTRDTLKIASSPIAIARCYANVGYALVDAGEYEDAAVFYTASVMFAPHPAVPMEMQHLASLMGHPIQRPSQKKVIDTMKKYEIEYGPDKKVIEVASQLAMNYINANNIPNALQALKITYNLTLDEGVKELILRLDPNSPLLKPSVDNETAQANRNNIARTENKTEE